MGKNWIALGIVLAMGAVAPRPAAAQEAAMKVVSEAPAASASDGAEPARTVAATAASPFTESASPMVAAAPVNQLPVKAQHKFFDRKNIGLSVMTFSAALSDGITTQHALGLRRTQTIFTNGRATTVSTTYMEANPLAAPLVNRGWAGQLAATALTTGADLSLRGWLHHMGHHRMERVVPFLFAATSATFAAHNAHYW